MDTTKSPMSVQQDQTIEWRQHRRAEVEAPIEIRGLDIQESMRFVTGQTKNVSLAGCYAIVPAPFPFPVGASIYCAITIPRAAMKYLPFSRIMGSGHVVRIEVVRTEADSQQESSGNLRVGLGIAFSRDVTALGTMRGYPS